MEIQFEQKPVRFLCRTAWGEKTVEETAEIKLPTQERQPDEILGTWGQPCLTEKHWSEGGVSVTGGVNVWVLLRSADGVQCVAGWVPFRQSWELHDSQRDGKVIIRSSLRSADARMTGAGKLIITAQISLYLQALEPCTANRYVPSQLPEDMYVQQNTVAVTVPLEAGEKRVGVEESMTPAQPVSTVLYHRAEPETVECRVMGDKLVFRGELRVHALCQGVDGGVFAAEEAFPVSQYIQLDGEYGSKAVAEVIPVLLSSEAEKDEEGHIAFRGNALWQYVLHDEMEVESVFDAYSNRRRVETDMSQLCIPLLAAREEAVQEAVCAFAPENGTLIDHAVMASCADWDERTGKLQQQGAVRVLYRDGEALLQSALLPFETETVMQQGEDGYVVTAHQKRPEAHWEVRGELHIRIPCSMYYMEDRCLPCCKGFTAADEPAKKENRPCFILRRVGGETLWQLAKASGSSEMAIRNANAFEGNPEKGRMLIIPVE